MQTELTYGCDSCQYYHGHRCQLWDVSVLDAANSSCDSLRRLSSSLSVKVANIVDQGPSRSRYIKTRSQQ